MFPGLMPVMTAIALIGFLMPATRGIANEYSSVIAQERKVERGSRIVVRNGSGDIRIEGSDRTTVEAMATERNSSQSVPVSITETSSGNTRIFTVSRSEERRVGKECRSRWRT